MHEFGVNTVGVLGPKDFAVNTDLPTTCANSMETPLASLETTQKTEQKLFHCMVSLKLSANEGHWRF
jgi:hypothetical protein